MKDLLFSVMAVSLFSGGILMLAPEGGLKKQIAFLSSLVLCLALFAPLFKLMGQEISLDLSLPDIPAQGEDDESNAVLAAAVDRICRELEEDVLERFSLDDALLSLTYDESDPSAVTFIAGVLRGRGQVEQAAAYLKELLGCPITAEISDQEEEHGIS